jgi:hypothetical protein
MIDDKEIAKKLKKAVKAKLLNHGSPRLQMTLILFFTSSIAFVSSTLMLKVFNITAMWFRYSAAALIAYLFFFFALWLWMFYIRANENTKIIMEEIISEADGELKNFLEGEMVEGIQSISSSGSETGLSTGDGGKGSGFSLDLDGDAIKGILIVIVVMVALSLLVVFGYIIVAAPALLSEALVDAAVVGAFYKRVRKIQGSNWLLGAIRGTWIPFVIIVAVLSIAGIVIQYLKPEFVSLGDVVRFILTKI